MLESYVNNRIKTNLTNKLIKSINDTT